MTTLVFHHLPKCAGTSCKAVFAQWFEVVEDYRRDWSEAQTNIFLQSRRDPGSLSPGQMLAGHFDIEGAFLHQRYPEFLEDSKFRLITFVRDPIEIPQSMHHYAKRKRPDYSVATVSERVSCRTNLLASLLQCNEADYASILDRYFFIGLVENLQASMDMLAQMLGMPSAKVPVRNATPRDERLSDSEREAFIAKNTLDYKIYRYCVRRNHQLLQCNG